MKLWRWSRLGLVKIFSEERIWDIKSFSINCEIYLINLKDDLTTDFLQDALKL